MSNGSIEADPTTPFADGGWKNRSMAPGPETGPGPVRRYLREQVDTSTNNVGVNVFPGDSWVTQQMAPGQASTAESTVRDRFGEWLRYIGALLSEVTIHTQPQPETVWPAGARKTVPMEPGGLQTPDNLRGAFEIAAAGMLTPETCKTLRSGVSDRFEGFGDRLMVPVSIMDTTNNKTTWTVKYYNPRRSDNSMIISRGKSKLRWDLQFGGEEGDVSLVVRRTEDNSKLGFSRLGGKTTSTFDSSRRQRASSPEDHVLRKITSPDDQMRLAKEAIRELPEVVAIALRSLKLPHVDNSGGASDSGRQQVRNQQASAARGSGWAL